MEVIANNKHNSAAEKYMMLGTCDLVDAVVYLQASSLGGVRLMQRDYGKPDRMFRVMGNRLSTGYYDTMTEGNEVQDISRLEQADALILETFMIAIDNIKSMDYDPGPLRMVYERLHLNAVFYESPAGKNWSEGLLMTHEFIKSGSLPDDRKLSAYMASQEKTGEMTESCLNDIADATKLPLPYVSYLFTDDVGRCKDRLSVLLRIGSVI